MESTPSGAFAVDGSFDSALSAAGGPLPGSRADAHSPPTDPHEPVEPDTAAAARRHLRRYNRELEGDVAIPLEFAVSPDGRVFTIQQPPPTVHRLASLSLMIQNSLVHLSLQEDGLFNALAGIIHQFQSEAIPALARLGRSGSGETPGSPELLHWQELPAIPLAAYQVYALKVQGSPTCRTFELPVATDPLQTQPADLVDTGDDGQHLSPGTIRFSSEGMALADTALSLHARQTLFAGSRFAQEPGPMLFLASDPRSRPDNSLAHYLERLGRMFGNERTRFLGQPHGVDVSELLSALDDAACSSVPSTVVASREGLFQVLSVLESNPLPCALPEGSRVLVVERSPGLPDYGAIQVLRDAAARLLGLAPQHIVSVLDRPALPGQFYTDCPSPGTRNLRPGWHAPAWMRVCALDPETLTPCPPGKLGLLFFVNLVNVERPLALLSDELGFIHPSGGILSSGDERFLRLPPPSPPRPAPAQAALAPAGSAQIGSAQIGSAQTLPPLPVRTSGPILRRASMPGPVTVAPQTAETPSTPESTPPAAEATADIAAELAADLAADLAAEFAAELAREPVGPAATTRTAPNGLSTAAIEGMDEVSGHTPDGGAAEAADRLDTTSSDQTPHAGAPFPRDGQNPHQSQ